MFRVGVLCVVMWGLVACGGKKAEPVAPAEVETAHTEPVQEPPPAAEPPAPKADKVFCGGIAGIACPEGQHCADDPDDGCDPAVGADCGGLCVTDAPDANQVPACPDTATHRYVADAQTCKRIRFACPDDAFVFGDDCGCGCTTLAPEK